MNEIQVTKDVKIRKTNTVYPERWYIKVGQQKASHRRWAKRTAERFAKAIQADIDSGLRKA